MTEFAFPFPPLGDRGLSKRELFAAMALQGLLAGKETEKPENAGVYAVQYADAVLAELAKPPVSVVPVEPYCEGRR